MKKLNLRICTRAVCFWMAYTAVLPLVMAQGLEYIKAHYTKYEYKIPMRDGIKLFTAVYVPKDSSQQYPMLIMRTPYGVAPYGEDNYKTSLGPAEKFAKEDFIFVYQDVRGQWMSEGEFVNVRPYISVKKGPQDIDESSDTYDTIDWLVKKVLTTTDAQEYGASPSWFYAQWDASMPIRR
jgi:predicted acyl esterase